jgi:hypothetical protein
LDLLRKEPHAQKHSFIEDLELQELTRVTGSEIDEAIIHYFFQFQIK